MNGDEFLKGAEDFVGYFYGRTKDEAPWGFSAGSRSLGALDCV